MFFKKNADIFRFSKFLEEVKTSVFDNSHYVEFLKTTPMALGVTIFDSLSALAISPAVYLDGMTQSDKNTLLSLVVRLYAVEDDINYTGIMRSAKKNLTRLEICIRKHDLTDVEEFTLNIKDDMFLDALVWLIINMEYILASNETEEGEKKVGFAT